MPLGFECFYCTGKFLTLAELIAHFEEKHRQGEYIVIETAEDYND